MVTGAQEEIVFVPLGTHQEKRGRRAPQAGHITYVKTLLRKIKQTPFCRSSRSW